MGTRYRGPSLITQPYTLAAGLFLSYRPAHVHRQPADDSAFDYSELLRTHGIVSVVNVAIEVTGAVWGVLEVDSAQLRRFDDDDREFLCGFAEIIGRTIENRRQMEKAEQVGLGRRIELQERETLFRELQHRIGNQLQLIIGALELASQRTTDQAARKAFDEVIRRAVSIAQSHEQLSLSRIENEVSLSTYLNQLVSTLGVPEGIAVITAVEDVTAPLGTAVRLGLIHGGRTEVREPQKTTRRRSERAHHDRAHCGGSQRPSRLVVRGPYLKKKVGEPMLERAQDLLR